MKPKVVVTWPISQVALSKLQEQYDVVVNQEERSLNEDEFKHMVQGASAILCLLSNKISSEVLDSAGPQLKIIASMSVGYDHIDLAACQAKNIVVTNTPGTSDRAVAEHTIALMLALARSIPQADQFVRTGQYKGWDPTIFVGPELGGKTLGIIGTGQIGRDVAKIASAGLGMPIIYNDIKVLPDFEQAYQATFHELDELLAMADFVTLHVPLLPATTHLINADRLAKMKPMAYLINTARGPIVDEVALLAALQNKQIAGAGLDVYEHEPQIATELLALPNVIFTPHTASATFEAREAMAQTAVANILTVLSGQPAPNAVKS